MGTDFSSRAYCDRTRVNGFKLKEADLDWIAGNGFVKRGWCDTGKCCSKSPIPGSIRGQVAQDSEQPDPVEGVPADCKEDGLDL